VLLQVLICDAGLAAAQVSDGADYRSHAELGNRRPFTLDDVLALEGLGDVALSPDGELIAAVIQRAREQGGGAPPGNLLGDDGRGDVWLLSSDGTVQRNLTDGSMDGSAHWNPVWSPDGKHLAMLSTRGGNNVRLYVWEREDDALRRLSNRGVELNADILGPDGVPREFAWINDSTIVAVLLPEGDPPLQFDQGVRAPLTASRAWESLRAGGGATASVIEARPWIFGTAPPVDTTSAQIALLSTTSHELRLSASVPVYGPALQIAIAPGAARAAVVLSTDMIYASPTRLDRANWGAGHRVGIVTLDSEARIRWIPRIAPAFAFANRYRATHGFGNGFTVGWAPDGSTLAVLGTPAEEDAQSPSVFVVRDIHIGNVAAELISPAELGPSALFWADDHSLLVHARECNSTSGTRSGLSPNSSTQFSWWLLETEEARPPSPIRSEPNEWPDEFVYSSLHGAVYGVVQGELWRVSASDRRAIRLTDRSAGFVTGIAWPRTGHDVGSHAIVLATLGDGRSELRLFDTSTDELGRARLKLPHRTARISWYVPGLDIALLRSGRGTAGPFLWRGAVKAGRIYPVIVLNPQLAAVAPAERHLVEYRGADGGTLKALLLLPPGGRTGTRHPLIVWVYPGSVVQGLSFGAAAEINVPTPYHPELLTSRGYAVLFPSMPLGEDGVAGDPYFEMPKGVMPAINRVIDLGFADSVRIGLLGVSYGGYGVFSLVSHTDRFAVAVGLAGITDLVSLYGTFDPRKRYDRDPYANLGQAVLAEGGQLRMGVPPWRDLWRYLRNSPIHYVDRIQTPLMMIHGDIDYVPVQQAEQLFAALHRRGRAVRLVRYWGEGHGITTPTNVRDMWSRIFDWFGQHLCDAELCSVGGADRAFAPSAPPG
jgi:dipeptidyl aminopeptidase/acylaminoacyl peptidase